MTRARGERVELQMQRAAARAQQRFNSSSANRSTSLRAESGKAAVGTIIGIVVSIAIIFGLVLGMDWAEFNRALSKLQVIYLIPIVFLFFLSYLMRALRWKLLLPSHLELSTMKLFQALIVGAFASAILPLRAGEFLRPWALSKWQPVSFATWFASVVTERVFDVLAMLTFLFLVLTQIPQPPELVTIGAKALGLFALGIMSIMIVSYFRAQTVLATTDRVFRLLFATRRPDVYRKLQQMAEEFVAGLRAISSLGELALVIGWSFALWFVIAIFYQLFLLSMGESPTLWVGMTVNVIIALAIAVPSAPGFIGTFQLGCVAALTTIYQYPREFSLAYSVVAHGIQFIFTLAAGMLVLQAEGLALKDLRKRAEEREGISAAGA